MVIEFSGSLPSPWPGELRKGVRRACPVLACQLRNRDLTVVTCSVSTIVRRTERGVQPGCGDDGLHDGRTGGQHDTSAAHRSRLPQSVPLPAGVLWTSLIKVRTWTLQSAARSLSRRRAGYSLLLRVTCRLIRPYPERSNDRNGIPRQ